MEYRAKILIADDQPDNLLILEDLLSQSYEVRTVSSGQAVLDIMAGDHLPDLLLLDVLMPPGPDGFQVCSRLKERAASRDVPIVFLTGLDGSCDEERGLALGADDFIRKPFVPLVVLARVRNLLSRRETTHRDNMIAIAEARLAEQQKVAETQRGMLDKLMAANTELERFTLVAAHDLREPLRTMTTFSQLLERQCDHLNAEERVYLRYITESAKRMYELIGGLVAYTQIADNMGRPQPASSARACDCALNHLAVSIAESGAEVTVAADLPEVGADQMQLTQVFQHLISNAVKFRDSARPSHISIAAHRDGAEWVFSVSDNGIGFDPIGQEVFELFRQLRRRDGFGGAGVGLAIAKRIVQCLGGRIWAESTPGQGATFFFTLPQWTPVES